MYTVYWIDLVAYPSMYTPYLDTEIPQNWYQPGQRDLLYIPGSPKGLVSVWGKSAHLTLPGLFVVFVS